MVESLEAYEDGRADVFREVIFVLSVPHFTYHDNTRVTPSTKRIKATNPIDCFTDIPPCFWRRAADENCVENLRNVQVKGVVNSCFFCGDKKGVATEATPQDPM